MTAPSSTAAAVPAELAAFARVDPDGFDVSDVYDAVGGPMYDDLCRTDDHEVPELLRALRGVSGDVLDLAAGAGRLSVPMLAAGRQVTALELSPTMLELLDVRLHELPERLRQRCSPIRGDIRDFGLDRQFGAIVLGTTSVSLLDAPGRAAMFTQVSRHLAEDGRFVLSNLEVRPDATGEPLLRTVTGAGGRKYCLAESLSIDRSRRTVAIWADRQQGASGRAQICVSEVAVVATATLVTEMLDAGLEPVAEQDIAGVEDRYRATMITARRSQRHRSRHDRSGRVESESAASRDRDRPPALWPNLLEPREHGASDLCVVSASGTRLQFADGRDRLCGTSGLWNVPLGYGNPRIAVAVAEAARRCSYGSVFRYENADARAAAERLIDTCGSDRFARVLFSTSGGAANDLVMKLARQFHAVGGDQRKLVVGLNGSYHGLTFGGFALTGEPLGQEAYGVDRRSVRHLEPNDGAGLQRLLEHAGGQVAAVVVEPVLGSGTVPLSDDFVEALGRARQRYGFLLVADEVATGFARTGPMFASQRWTVPPDVLITSKALTNGTCAAAAVAVSHEVAARFDRTGSILVHAETQAGTAITGAAITATLQEMERVDVVGLASAVSDRLQSALDRLIETSPSAVAQTGRGAFRSLRLVDPGGEPLSATAVLEVVAAIRAEGAIVHPGVSGIQLVPALIYGDPEMEELTEKVGRGLRQWRDAASGRGSPQ